MEPENQPLEKEIPFGNHHFQISCETLITLEVYVRLSLQNPHFLVFFLSTVKGGPYMSFAPDFGAKIFWGKNFRRLPPPFSPHHGFEFVRNQVLLGSPRTRTLTGNTLVFAHPEGEVEGCPPFFLSGRFCSHPKKKNEFIP